MSISDEVNFLLSSYSEYDSRRSFPFGLSPIPEVPSELASEISSNCSSTSGNIFDFKDDHWGIEHFGQNISTLMYSESFASVNNEKTRGNRKIFYSENEYAVVETEVFLNNLNILENVLNFIFRLTCEKDMKNEPKCLHEISNAIKKFQQFSCIHKKIHNSNEKCITFLNLTKYINQFQGFVQIMKHENVEENFYANGKPYDLLSQLNNDKKLNDEFLLVIKNLIIFSIFDSTNWIKCYTCECYNIIKSNKSYYPSIINNGCRIELNYNYLFEDISSYIDIESIFFPKVMGMELKFNNFYFCKPYSLLKDNKEEQLYMENYEDGSKTEYTFDDILTDLSSKAIDLRKDLLYSIYQEDFEITMNCFTYDKSLTNNDDLRKRERGWYKYEFQQLSNFNRIKSMTRINCPYLIDTLSQKHFFVLRNRIDMECIIKKIKHTIKKATFVVLNDIIWEKTNIIETPYIYPKYIVHKVDINFVLNVKVVHDKIFRDIGINDLKVRKRKKKLKSTDEMDQNNAKQNLEFNSINEINLIRFNNTMKTINPDHITKRSNIQSNLNNSDKLFNTVKDTDCLITSNSHIKTSKNLRHSRLFKLLQDLSYKDLESSKSSKHQLALKFVDNWLKSETLVTMSTSNPSFISHSQDPNAIPNVYSVLYDKNNNFQKISSSILKNYLNIKMELQELENFPSNPGIEMSNLKTTLS